MAKEKPVAKIPKVKQETQEKTKKRSQAPSENRPAKHSRKAGKQESAVLIPKKDKYVKPSTRKTAVEADEERAVQPVKASKGAATKQAVQAENTMTPEKSPSNQSMGRPKKLQRLRQLSKPGGEDVLIDEHGQSIPLPPKHGTPVVHARRKKAMDSPDPEVTIRLHARQSDGKWGQYPSAIVSINPHASLAELKARIHSNCKYLPPHAQKLFRRTDEGLEELEGGVAQSCGTLSQAGYTFPGPHEIWMEIDVAAICNPSGAPESSTGPPAAPRAISEDMEVQASPAQEKEAASGVGKELVVADEIPQEDIEEESDEELVHAPPQPPAQHFRPSKELSARKHKRWTAEEVENLLLGLMKYGTSSWTKIAERWHFPDRTTVDLKDKWRNLVKNVREGRPTRGTALSDEAKARIARILHENNPELPGGEWPNK